MIHILAAIITLEFFWSPNPVGQNIIRYEVVVSSSPDLAGAQVLSAGTTPRPDGKVYHTVTGWDTAVKKYAAVRAVNNIGPGPLSPTVEVGEPSAPANLDAKRQ